MIETILQQVTRIPLAVSWRTRQVRLGQHRSRQRGAGLDFDQIRVYQLGEAVRHINWAATARRGGTVPLVNSYDEEKDLTVLLLIDFSASMHFGSTRRTKRALAAEISASLVYSALAAHDRIGLLGFAADVVCYLPPRQQRTYQRLIPETILQREAGQGPAHFGAAVARLERWVKHAALVFLISDFLTDDTESLRQALMRLRRRHDVIALVVRDPLEANLPAGQGRMVTRDLETGAVRSLSLTRANQRRMAAQAAARQAHLHRMLQQCRLPSITVTPHSNYVADLSQLFLRGHRRANA